MEKETSEEKFYVTIRNLKEMCRICLEDSKEMTNIHNNANALQLSIAQMITFCTDLKVEEHDFVSYLVCSTCKEELIQATKFRFKFNRSHKFINEFLLDVVSKNIQANQIVIIDTISDDFKSSVMQVSYDDETKHNANHEVEQIPEQVEKPHKCAKCGEGFDSKVKRAHHQRVFNHYTRQTVICSECNLEVPIGNYKVHFLKHTASCKCDICGKTFSNNFNLRRHKNLHLKINPYACNQCNLKFSRRDKLKQHMDMHSSLCCCTCNKKFKNDDLFKGHLNDDGRCVGKYQRIHSCDVCFKKFTLIKSLNLHKLCHTDESIICPQCGQPYPNEEKLNYHITSVHCKDVSKSKEFLCYICAKQYSSEHILKRHIVRHLGLAQKFHCDTCKKSFTQSHSLYAHLKIHTGEKLFVCHICSKSFNKPYNLERHLNIHYNIKPHKCTICEKSFSCKQSLVIHTRTHTGEKPYSCDFCTRSFSDRSSLVKHTRLHGTDS